MTSVSHAAVPQAANSHQSPSVEGRGLSKAYHSGSVTIDVLRDVDIVIEGGETVAVMGPSGSGKSTLLKILGLLVDPDRGAVATKGQLVDDDRRARGRLRNGFFGFVDQEFAIIDDETALANVMIPLEYATPRPSRSERKRRSEDALSSVGLHGRGRQLARRFSGGERQRIAIARALVNHPTVLLADEPTAALDRATATSILDLMFDRSETSSVVVATHDPMVAERCDRVLTLEDGRVVAHP